MFLLIQKAATEDAHQTKVCTFLGTELHLDLVLGAKVRAAQAHGDKRHHCPHPAKENLALRRMPRVKTLARSSASAKLQAFWSAGLLQNQGWLLSTTSWQNTNLPYLHNASYRKQREVYFTNKIFMIRTAASWTWHLLNLLSQEQFLPPELHWVSFRSIKKCSLHFFSHFRIFPHSNSSSRILMTGKMQQGCKRILYCSKSVLLWVSFTVTLIS